MVLTSDSVDPVLLTGPAALLWEMLEASAGAETVVSALADMHAMSPASVLGEIGPMIDQLVDLGVVERVW